MLKIVHNAYSIPSQLLKHFTTSFNATFCSFKVADFQATFSNYVWSYALRCDFIGDAHICCKKLSSLMIQGWVRGGLARYSSGLSRVIPETHPSVNPGMRLGGGASRPISQDWVGRAPRSHIMQQGECSLEDTHDWWEEPPWPTYEMSRVLQPHDGWAELP